MKSKRVQPSETIVPCKLAISSLSFETKSREHNILLLSEGDMSPILSGFDINVVIAILHNQYMVRPSSIFEPSFFSVACIFQISVDPYSRAPLILTQYQ